MRNAKNTREELSLRCLKTWSGFQPQVGWDTNLLEPPHTKADFLMVYKFLICLRFLNSLFLVFPLYCHPVILFKIPVFSWINNPRRIGVVVPISQWTPLKLQSRSRRQLWGLENILSPQMTKGHHRWFIRQAIKQCSILFVPHFFLKTCYNTLMDEVKAKGTKGRVRELKGLTLTYTVIALVRSASGLFRG